MNRKEFIKTASVFLSGAFLGNFSSSVKVENFRQLRKGIGIYTNRGGTIGWLVRENAVIIVDSQFPDTAKKFYSNLKKMKANKISVLLNTHHHRDHTSGNTFLAKHSGMIVANENCVRLQKKRNVGTPLDKNKVTANVTFQKEWTFELEGEKVFAYHFGPAHTGGDSVVHFVNANVAHMGDLVFNRVYPFVNLKDEASLAGWIKFLDDAYNRFDNDTLFIYGHSFSPDNVFGGKGDLRFMRNYIEALLNYVKKGLRQGRGLKDLQKTNSVPGFEEMKPLWKTALQDNIKTAYEELSRG